MMGSKAGTATELPSAEAVEVDARQRAKELVAAAWHSHRDEGIDVAVLGCTHYALIREEIRTVVGPEVQVTDSNAAVARQVKRVWDRLFAEEREAAPHRRASRGHRPFI